jgi:ABC-type glutathione transport system ATPase component
MALRLPVGEMTALLGPGLARRRVMTALDESTGSASGGGTARVVRLTAAAQEPTAARCERVAGCGGAALVLADRVTDGLDAACRRTVLVALRDLAATGVAVLVDDADPVATMAVADGVLRIDRGGGLSHERVAPEGWGEDYLAS